MIADIRLQHFRSYDDETYTFSKGVNIIVGPNAIGKTNLLESILVVCRGSSYRVHDHELISYGNDWARLQANTDQGVRIVKIVQSPLSGKSYELAGRPFKRLGLPQIVPVVLFEPDHLQLLHGSPDGRREYLDGLLEQTRPGFAKLKREYKRTIAQRNALLKRGSAALRSQMFPWDVRVSELGGSIVQERLTLLIAMNTRTDELYSSLAGKPSQLELHYVSNLPTNNYETHLLKKLELNFDRDLERGFTGAGPHREDFSAQLNGHMLQHTASRGEVRTSVLMLKVLELQLLEQARDESPLLLLDDVFSELDKDRRAALTTYLQNYQTFMTTTDVDVVSTYFPAATNVLSLN